MQQLLCNLVTIGGKIFNSRRPFRTSICYPVENFKIKSEPNSPVNGQISKEHKLKRKLHILNRNLEFYKDNGNHEQIQNSK